MAKGILAFIFAVLLFIGGCDKVESGYVQIRVVPATMAETISLYLDGTKLDFSRGPTVTLQYETGRLALKAVDSVWSPAICHLLVRKDRITALTVLGTRRPPSCVCEIRAPGSDAHAVVCA